MAKLGNVSAAVFTTVESIIHICVLTSGFIAPFLFQLLIPTYAYQPLFPEMGVNVETIYINIWLRDDAQ
jgi:hypothetical protein